ncbi:TPA: hypothetical protein SAP37_001645 [Burkholderia multivorans]|nr:hypothetical protein [Burkholderia multivorans]HEF4823884.1 hypothetical protein [Burkholderia multivorans]
MTSLPPDGFLSPDIDAWRHDVREIARDWFALAEDINRASVAILVTLAPSRGSDRELGAAAMFARALQSFEAVILLTERGMLADAGALARNIVESAIYLGGLAMIADFPQRMAASNNAHFASMAVALATHLEDDMGDTEAATGLRTLVDDVKAKGYVLKDIKLLQLAKEVGLDPLYQVVYRKLSGDSAHASLESMNRHLVRNASGRIEKLKFSPQRDGIEHILSAAIAAFLGAMEVLYVIFPQDEIRLTIDVHNTRHHALSPPMANQEPF